VSRNEAVGGVGANLVGECIGELLDDELLAKKNLYLCGEASLWRNLVDFFEKDIKIVAGIQHR